MLRQRTSRPPLASLVAALVAALVLTCAAAPSVARAGAPRPRAAAAEPREPWEQAEDETPEDAARRAALRRNVEWIEMNIGGGVLFFPVDEQHNPGHLKTVSPLLRADLLLFNLHWPRLYWSVLELHPVWAVGFLGGGTRLGLRLPVSADGRHELRFGCYMGMDVVFFDINAIHPTLAFAPHVQLVYNTRRGSIGAGLDVPIHLTFRESMSGMDSRSSSTPPVLTGVVLYFRWSVWRTSW